MVKLNCKDCKGKCCKYIAIEIDTPEDREDFENIRWYVAHKNVVVYVDCDNVWHVEFLTPCEFLTTDGLCKIYEKRPEICREYNQDECTFHNDYEEKYSFKSLNELDEFIKNKFNE